MSLKWLCELAHVLGIFLCTVSDKPFMVMDFCCQFLNIVHTNQIWLMFEEFIFELVILHKNKCIFSCGFDKHFTWPLCTSVCLCRMAIQVDKFDFDSMPVTDHDALRLATVRQQEEKRQQVQGGLINSTLDIHWTIISFTESSCPHNPYSATEAEHIWARVVWVLPHALFRLSVTIRGCIRL